MWENILKDYETILIGDDDSYKLFAKKVANALKDYYGEHNYAPFLEELRKLLGE
mgnify:CR=1 FL=1|tara:strand:- start:411 stop:572 length:162 start_codon:yes stop_codon:yes gene_type:complete